MSRPLPIIAHEGESYSSDHERPKTRGECADGARPCPFASCRHHLFIDCIGSDGEPRSYFADIESMPESCSLDVAERGGATLEELGEHLGLTRERMRQVEQKALIKLKTRLDRDMLDGWTSPTEDVPDAGVDDFFSAEFKAQVTKAYERIVPENERGSQLLRYGKPATKTDGDAP